MLLVFQSTAEFDFAELSEVYTQSIEYSGKVDYARFDIVRQRLEAQQDFYAFLRSFINIRDAVYLVWAEHNRYRSALRIEPYEDGYLLEGLETAPDQRKKGFAQKLMGATIEYCKKQKLNTLYVHIERKNAVSVYIHRKFGFEKILNYGRCIDGSVCRSMDTYILKLQ